MNAATAPPRTVAQWLDYQLSLHSAEIELGLDRVRRLADRLGLLPPAHRTVTIGGTNGKGSTVALVAHMLGRGARVGTYTSPHLWRYNERIAIDGMAVDDDALVAAFAAVEAARGTHPLTFFEFGTLAALWLFREHAVDLAVLEVGLGGRLDAVNIVDADVAAIVSIGLDHTAWLGPTRETIATEKAGIMRPGQPAFCGDRNPPDTLTRAARQCGARLSLIGGEFDLIEADGVWHWRSGDTAVTVPAHPAVHPDNLAVALAVVAALDVRPTASEVRDACAAQARLPGRREVIDGPIPIIYDVGHNEEAVALLVAFLMRHPVPGRTHVVLGMLEDKPVERVARCLAAVADRLYPAGLDRENARGLTAHALAGRIGHAGATYPSPPAALESARRSAVEGDRIVVCGSFHTVAQARRPDHE